MSKRTRYRHLSVLNSSNYNPIYNLPIPPIPLNNISPRIPLNINLSSPNNIPPNNIPLNPTDSILLRSFSILLSEQRSPTPAQFTNDPTASPRFYSNSFLR